MPTRLTRQQSLFLLVLILLLATATRLHTIEERSLWADEGWTLDLGRGPTLPDVVERMTKDVHPPLYFVIFNYWQDVAGDTEFGMRYLSFIFGIIGVAGIYQLGKMTLGEETGLLGAFLLAVWDHHIDISQDMRHYTLIAVLIIFSSYFYFRLIKHAHPPLWIRVVYGAFIVAGLYVHYLTSIILLFQGVHALFFVRPFKKLFWLGVNVALAGVFFLPWIPIILDQNEIRWSDPLHYDAALPNNGVTHVLVRDALLGQQYAITLILIFLGLVYITYRQDKMKIKLHPYAPIFFLLLWGAGFALFPFFVQIRDIYTFLTMRIMSYPIYALLLLTAHGLTNLPRGLRNLLIGVLLVVNLTTVDARQIKPSWREVTQNVTEFHNDGESIIMDIWVGDWPVRYYVEQQMGKDTEWISVREAASEYGDQFLPQMLNFIQNEDAFWLIYWGDEPSQYGYEKIFADEGFQLTASPYEIHEGTRLYSHRYDRVADDVITTYADVTGDIFALHKATLHGELLAGEDITVTLLWTAESPPPADYSVSVVVLDENGVTRAQHDGPPFDGQAMTSTWEVGRLQYDQHKINLPIDLPLGNYTIGVKVYFYQAQDNPLQTPCANDIEQLCDSFVVDTLEIATPE